MSCNGQLLSMTILVTYDMTISISPPWVGPREASIRNSVNLCSTWRDYWIMVIPAIPPDSVKSYLELEDLSGQSAWNTNGNTKRHLFNINIHSNNIYSLLTKIYAIFIQISSFLLFFTIAVNAIMVQKINYWLRNQFPEDSKDFLDEFKKNPNEINCFLPWHLRPRDI